MTSQSSGKTYRVALRGTERGDSYCSCPDFRVEHVGDLQAHPVRAAAVKSRFSAQQLERGFRKWVCRPSPVRTRDRTAAAGARRRRRQLETRLPGCWIEPIEDVPQLLTAIQALERAGETVVVYPDAEEWIQQRLHDRNIAGLVSEIRKNPAKHPLRNRVAQGAAAAVPVGWHRVRRGSRPRRAGGRHGTGQDDSGHRRGGTAVARGRRAARARRLPRVAEVPVAQRNPAVLRSRLPARDGLGRGTLSAVRQRLLLHDLQLRTGTAGPATDRTGEVGSDHSGRRPADQELGGEDIARDQVAAVAHSPWCCRARRWRTGWTNCTPWCSSSTTGGWGPASASSTAIASWTRRARSSATRTWTNCARTCSPSCCGARASRCCSNCRNARPRSCGFRPARSRRRLSIGERHSAAAQIAAKTFLTEMDLLRIQKHLLVARMAADSTFLVNKKEPAYLHQAGVSGRVLRAAVCGSRIARRVLFSEWTTMLDLIEKLLASVHRRLRPARRLRAAEEATAAGPPVSEGSRAAACS